MESNHRHGSSLIRVMVKVNDVEVGRSRFCEVLAWNSIIVSDDVEDTGQ